MSAKNDLRLLRLRIDAGKITEHPSSPQAAEFGEQLCVAKLKVISDWRLQDRSQEAGVSSLENSDKWRVT